MGTKSTGSRAVRDIEGELEGKYGNYFNDIEMSVDLSGNKDSINFRVSVNLKEYKDEWKDRTNVEIENYCIKYILISKRSMPALS